MRSPGLEREEGIRSSILKMLGLGVLGCMLDNHFSPAIYMEIFFNVNVIRKYKQGSNLAQNHPKENKNKETTQKARGASSYSKEE